MIYAFADFELDVLRRELRRGGQVVEVQPRSFELLVLLLSREGEYLSRRDALEALWPDEDASDHALTQAIYKLRRALSADPGSAAWIETRRGLGLRFVPGRIGSRPAAAHAPSPRAPVPTGGRPLFERDEALERLDRVLDRAEGSDGQVVVVSGVAGIGKTSLLTRVMARATERRFEVRLGRALARSEAPAFAPWASVVSDMIEARGPKALDRALGARAAHLARIAPAMLGALPVRSPGPVAEPEAQLQAFEAFVALLRVASSERPVLIALEDLQWMDASSFSMLRELVPRIRGLRIALLLTARTDELASRSELLDALREIETAPSASRIPLEGLSPQGVRELLRELGRGAALETLAEAMHRRTGGNPFFVVQCASLLYGARELATDELPRTDAELGRALQVLPQGVRAVVSRRVAHLPPSCQEILRLAALVVGDFEAGLLAAAAGVPEPDCRRALEEAAVARIVERLDERSGRYRFLHDLLRDALASELSPVRYAELHRRLGEAIEQRHGAALGPWLGSVSYHFGEALGVGTHEKALHYAQAAGLRSMEVFQFEEADRQFARALAAVDASAAPDPRIRTDLLLARGAALEGASSIEEARKVFLQALAAARELRDARRFAAAALGHATRPIWPDWSGPVPHLEEAIERLGDRDPAVRIRLELRLGHWLSYQLEDRDRVHRLLAGCCERAAALEDRTVFCESLISRCLVLGVWGTRDRAERVAAADRAVAVAEELGDEMRMLAALHAGLRSELEQGAFEAADRRFERFVALADRLRSIEGAWQAAVYRALRHGMTGRFVAAERELASVAEGAATSRAMARPDTLRIPSLQAGLWVLQRERGETTSATTGTFASRWFAEAALVRAGVALVLAEAGNRALAEGELARLVADDFAVIRKWENPIATAALLVQVAAALGDAPRSEALHAFLAGHAGHWVIVLESAACIGPVDYYLGLAAAVGRRWDAAEASLGAAAESAGKAGAAPWLARAQAALARVLAARGRVRDAKPARALLAEAAATARALGMQRLQAEIAGVSLAPEA